jgi:uncharacterized damage-inducible protein DinB
MSSLATTLDLMTAERDWFLALAAREDPHTPLGADEWSLAQTIEHLVLVERGFLAGIMRAKDPLPERTPEQDALRAKVNAILQTGEKYEVPVSGVDPGAQPDPDQLRADWEKVRERLRARIENGLPGDDILVAVHPIAGPLNAAEALEFLANHLIYHRVRVEQLLARGSHR